MSLSIALRSEIVKSKKTVSFYLTIVVAAVVPWIFVLDATFSGVSPENRSSIFAKMFAEGCSACFSLIKDEALALF